MGGPGSPYKKPIGRERLALQVSAEHLVAREYGGDEAAGNIVAAHIFCNTHRHRSKQPLEPEAFTAKVSRQLGQGQWFSSKDRSLLLKAARIQPASRSTS